MRIAIFTDTYLPDKNGVSMSIDNFTKMLADEGHQIMIFCAKRRLHKDKDYPKITIKRYASITAPSYKDIQIALPFIWRAVKDLRDFNADVVHIQTPIGMGWIGLWATKILKIKNIQTYHTYIPDFLVYFSPKTLLGINKITNYISSSRLTKSEISEKSPKLIKFNKRIEKMSHETFDEDPKADKLKFNERFGRDYTCAMYNRADLVLTPSGAMKEALVEHGITADIEVLSNGVKYDFFKKKTDYRIKNKIIHAGRLGHEKNIDVIIKAFNVAQKINPDLRLDIFGDGPARPTLQTLAKSLGVSKKVKFWGPYDIEKLAKSFCDYDYFITASTIETQGIVILEAMAAGLPVIGVNKLAVPEVVLNGQNGYVSEAFDYDEMAENMLKLLESDEKLEKYGKKSLQIAKEHEIDKCKEQLLAFYREVAEN